LRIARDLHDLLGHHLAALSINLEVARHMTGGEAREQIEKSQAVTKLLLSDVRDVVSRMREDEPVDLTAAVKSLSDRVRKPGLDRSDVDARQRLRRRCEVAAVIRVCLVEDQTIVRQGLRTLLGLNPDIAIVAEAADGEEAIEAIEREKPDVVLLDLRMPRLDG